METFEPPAGQLRKIVSFLQVCHSPNEVSNFFANINGPIKYNYTDLTILKSRLTVIPTESMKIMIDHLPYVFKDLIRFCDIFTFFLYQIQQESRIKPLCNNNMVIQHLYLLLEKGYASDVMENITSKVPIIIFLNELPVHLFSEIVYTLMSYGFKFTLMDMCFIYDYYGHCDLIKLMLHLDYSRIPSTYLILRGNGYTIMTDLLVDMSKSLEELVVSSNDWWYTRQSCDLLNHTALPIIRKWALQSNEPSVLRKASCLPKVPTLLELARNASRQSIIKFYKIQKSWQYHTVINRLGLPLVCQKMLTFEKKLYPTVH